MGGPFLSAAFAVGAIDRDRRLLGSGSGGGFTGAIDARDRRRCGSLSEGGSSHSAFTSSVLGPRDTGSTGIGGGPFFVLPGIGGGPFFGYVPFASTPDASGETAAMASRLFVRRLASSGSSHAMSTSIVFGPLWGNLLFAIPPG